MPKGTYEVHIRVARSIPRRRELKVYGVIGYKLMFQAGRKVYPEEKGTESSFCALFSLLISVMSQGLSRGEGN